MIKDADAEDSEDEIVPSPKKKKGKKAKVRTKPLAPRCINCNAADGIKKCQYCDDAYTCNRCAVTKSESYDVEGHLNILIACRCGRIGPGDPPGPPHACGYYFDWQNWCVGCQEWHCFDCVEIGCSDSDVEDDCNDLLQASYKKFGGKDAVQAKMVEIYNTGMGYATT